MRKRINISLPGVYATFVQKLSITNYTHNLHRVS
jgi:hypothetical protein